MVVVGAIGFNSYNAHAQSPAPEQTTVSSITDSGVDLFLKIDDIEGESADKDHPREIEIESYQWGASLPSKTGGAAGKVSFQDLNFTKKVDKSSPILMQSVASGKHYKEATLTARKKGEEKQEYLIVKMKDIIITSYQTGGSNNSLPTDEVSINFAQIEYKYTPQTPDGSLGIPVTAGWDLKTNKSL